MDVLLLRQGICVCQKPDGAEDQCHAEERLKRESLVEQEGGKENRYHRLQIGDGCGIGGVDAFECGQERHDGNDRGDHNGSENQGPPPQLAGNCAPVVNIMPPKTVSADAKITVED